jgi:hypothetical protein
VDAVGADWEAVFLIIRVQSSRGDAGVYVSY